MQYKILTDSELQVLELEFKQFLITNEIYDEEWKKINETDADQAIALVEQFSDIVWDKALLKINYFAFFSKSEVKAFWYRNDWALLLGIRDISGELDFTQENWLEIIQNNLSVIEVYQQEKQVNQKHRNQEVFKMINSGALIIKSDYFKVLHQLILGGNK